MARTTIRLRNFSPQREPIPNEREDRKGVWMNHTGPTPSVRRMTKGAALSGTTGAVSARRAGASWPKTTRRLANRR